MTNGTLSLDALLPPEMAQKAEQIGVKKAGQNILTLFALAVLAGAFVAFGGIFSTSITAGAKDMLPFGVIKLLAGLAFTVGLILVVVGGAELFTGNMLIVMACASGKVTLWALLRNWVVVYVGNFVGAIATAAMMFLSRQFEFGGGVMGSTILATGEAKTSLGFLEAVVLGILCNTVVCMAIWLTYSARSTTDKVMVIIPLITGFVAAGFEHSIANMYFIPMALFVKDGAGQAFFDMIHKTAADFPHLTWVNFWQANLLPVTIGNIIGGAVMVGLAYWFIFLRKHS